MAAPILDDHALTGLTDAEVRDRMARGEVNTIQEGPSRTTAEIIRSNVVTRFNILLGILLVVILVIVQEPKDALFGIVLVTNAAIGIVQELRAKATLDRLALLTAPTSRVVRGGRPINVPVGQIVRGDVIALGTGDQLPVDGPVLATRGLEIDESLLTGESDPVLKNPGDICLSGSFAVAGSGFYRADRIGAEAYAVALAREAKRFTLVRSELRDGVDWIIRGVSWAVGPMIALLVWSSHRADVGYREALRSAVSGAVGMIPQGLVLLTSIAFAVGVVRLGKRNVLVQELPAIEGLARVDTICFDKTGTLTEGKLVVQAIDQLGDIDPAPALAALAAAEPDPNATLRAIGSSFAEPPGWVADAAIPFSSARKWSAASFADSGTWVLGAPEILTPADQRVAAGAAEHAAMGRRVVLLAWTDYRIEGDRLPRRLQPVALVVLGDKVRKDASETLRYFARQGVQAKVISGDHPNTVAAIARQVGVPGSAEVVDGRDLPTDPEAFARVVNRATVFGRVTPHQKRAMVGALQSRGHVVAMTGDGVNDVLALKDSDVGIAIGSGSAASRSVAQLVLINGEFDTLPGVVGEGRRVISNIERVANLFVTKTVYAIFVALAVGLVGRPFPFLPRHLTLVGSLTIGIPAFFLALAPSAERAKPGFVLRVLRFAIPTGVAAGLASFGAYELAMAEETPLNEARTVATLVLAAIGLFALGVVARPLVLWKRVLIGSMAGFVVLLFLTGGSQDFFELRLPRLVVLLAGVGIIALTGTAMIGTLIAVGWIRRVPEYLREHPEAPRQSLQIARKRLRGFLGIHKVSRQAHEDQPGEAETPQVTEDEAEPPIESEVETDQPDEEDHERKEPPTVLQTIDWFDPDSDLDLE